MKASFLGPWLRAPLAALAMGALAWPSSPTLLTASDRFGPHPRWVEAEEELKRDGLETDAEALIQVLRAPAREVGDVGRQTWDPVRPLVLQLADRASDLKIWAAEVLGLRGDREASEALFRVAREDDNEAVRTAAWIALARLGSQEAARAIEEIMHESARLFWRLYLATRLAELGDARGYRYVLEAAASSDPSERESAALAIVEFVPLEREEELAKDPVDVLRRLSRDNSPRVRRYSVFASTLAIRSGAFCEGILALLEEMAHAEPDPELREQVSWQTEHVRRRCEESSGGEPVRKPETSLRPTTAVPIERAEGVGPR